MKFSEFIASRVHSDDLRQFPDSPYGARNNEPDTYEEPIEGYAYCDGSYAIQGPYAQDNGYTVFIQFEQSFPDLLSAELELWYYYGRFVGNEVHPNFWERLEMACRSSDLDCACRYVQDGLGQHYGDTAALFFSHIEESGGPNSKNWRDANLELRFDWMRDYVSQELGTVSWRLQPDSTDAIFSGK